MPIDVRMLTIYFPSQDDVFAFFVSVILILLICLVPRIFLFFGNFRSDLYEELSTNSANVASVLTGHLTPQMRYRLIQFRSLEESAESGCWFCRCIQEGVRVFWDELIPGSEMCGLEEEDSYGVCVQLRPGQSLIVSWVWSSHVLEVADGSFGPKHVLSDDHWIRLMQPLEFYNDTGTSQRRSPQNCAFGASRNIASFLDLEQCRNTVNPWVESCNLDHPACQGRDTMLPRRVLDISTDNVRLVESRGLQQERYATLSHCWGSPGAGGVKFQTIKNNLKARNSGTQLEDFPKTFLDAIRVVRLIGCDYIWIDSLCIIQDDEQDWKEQAMQMASIYANSYLNIGATASSNNKGGCLKTRRVTYESIGMDFDVEEPRRSHHIQGNAHVRRYCDTAHRHFSEAVETHLNAPPLLTRAWVFQERLLAPRTLHFAGSELVWECRTCMKCECGGVERLEKRHWFKSQFDQSLKGCKSRAEVLDVWLRVVTQYSKLNLTYQSDWPFALAGLATVVERQVQCRYLAGIWEADLPRALLWRNLSWNKYESKETGAPTWSCNSRHLQLGTHDSEISYSALLEYGFKQDDRLAIDHQSCFCEVADNNQFGAVTSGWLKMKAALHHGSLRLSQEDGKVRSWQVEFETKKGPRRFNIWTDYDPSSGRIDRLTEGNEVVGLLVGTTTQLKSREYIIVLASVQDQTARYHRIGIAYLDSAEEVFKGVDPSSVEII